MVSKTHAIEIISVLITSAVLSYLGIVAGVNLIAIDTPPPDGPNQDALNVTVLARQFYWTFIYAPNSSITFPNGTTMHYPNGISLEDTFYVTTNEVVYMQVESLDVNHSFFIPQLGIHIDAIPGHDNHYWFTADAPGQYLIECTQFCGTGHYTMIATLIVVP